jgi:hypothetical protein
MNMALHLMNYILQELSFEIWWEQSYGASNNVLTHNLYRPLTQNQIWELWIIVTYFTKYKVLEII